MRGTAGIGLPYQGPVGFFANPGEVVTLLPAGVILVLYNISGVYFPPEGSTGNCNIQFRIDDVFLGNYLIDGVTEPQEWQVGVISAPIVITGGQTFAVEVDEADGGYVNYGMHGTIYADGTV